MSSTEPITTSGAAVDLSPRMAYSSAVVGSPALAAETIVASVTIPTGITIAQGIQLSGMVAFTGGTSGVSANVRIRQTSVTGSVIVASGALTIAATDLYCFSVDGVDTAPVAGQVYKLTLIIGSGAAVSTVSAVYLSALCI